GHIDVRQNDDQFGADPVRQLIERLLAGGSEMQDIGALPRLAAEALAKHLGDVGLVVDDEDAEAHAVMSSAYKPPPIPSPAGGGGLGWGPRGARRGKGTMNSVNSPATLSTSIAPPCCWVTIS